MPVSLLDSQLASLEYNESELFAKITPGSTTFSGVKSQHDHSDEALQQREQGGHVGATGEAHRHVDSEVFPSPSEIVTILLAKIMSDRSETRLTS